MLAIEPVRLRRLQSLRSTELAFAAILLFGLLGMTARNATDPDLWWHLRTGQWIVESGYVPHSDPFSFTRAGHAWISHEWLSEVVFYELWKHGGFAALIVFSAIITTAGFMLLYLRCRTKAHWAAAATALGALAASPSWGVRPQMFTFTLASLLLWLLERGENRPKLLFWIPPLFLIWLNLHAGFALGPALLFAYGFGLLWENATGSTAWTEARPKLLRVFALLAACLALVPFNPSGTQLYRYPFHTLRSTGMRSFISEWFSPDFHQLLYRPFLLFWLLVFTALAISRARPKGRTIFPLLLTGLASVDAVRHIPIFILVALPVIVAAIPVGSESLPNFNWRNKRLRIRPLFNGAVIILIAVFAVVKWVVVVHNQKAREAELFPQAAVASLKSSDIKSSDASRRLFAYYDWGGYAIWKLYPGYRVFVDGRADLYGDDLLRQALKTALNLRTGWREVLDHWQIEVVLVPPSCALAQGLLLDPGWRAVFSDPKAVVFVRSQPAGQNRDISTAVTQESAPLLGQKSEIMFPRSVPNLRN
jgi:hypothetical protein